MKKNILVFLDKLKYLHSGLGVTSLLFGETFAKTPLEDIEYTYLVPKEYVGYFGDNIKYVSDTLINRFTIKYSKKYDIIHYIHQDFKFFQVNRNALKIITLHDLNFLHTKKGMKLKKYSALMKLKLELANHIICISEYTKKELIKFNDYDTKKISIIPHRGKNFLDITPTMKRMVKAPKDFLLFVGELREYKNVIQLVEVIKHTNNITLVIVGGGSKKAINNLTSHIHQNHLQEKVFFLQNCSDEEYLWCFQQCKGYISLSKAEGMGIPIIEALSFNKKPFLSQDTCHRETGGDFSFYFTSSDTKTMAKELEHEIKNNGYHFQKHQLSDIENHLKKYSWKKNYQKTISLYRVLLSQKK